MNAANRNRINLKMVPRDRWLLAASLVIICAVFLALRIRNVGQTLTWDEAQFALAVRSFLFGLKDEYSLYINIHPPAYLLICSFLSKYLFLGAFWYRMVSLLFALGSLLLVYALARKLFDERTAFLASFFFAVMPAAIVMDVWVKQDSMVTFFILLTVFFFVGDKYVLSGLSLGAGMLTKETAIFALMIISAYSLISRDWKKVKGSLLAGIIGALLSFWWFIWFSSHTGNFWGYFRGGTPESITFAAPWYYYLQGLVADTGWLLLILVSLGLGVSLYKIIHKEIAYLIPSLWFVGVNVFIALSVGKTYWMITGVLPAIALLSAIGFEAVLLSLSRIFSNGSVCRNLSNFLAVIVLSTALYLGINTSYEGYNRGKLESYWDHAALSREDGDFVNSISKEGDLVFTLFALRRDPIFTFYMGKADYYPLVRSVLESPQSLVDVCRRESGAKLIYIQKALKGENVPGRISQFLASFGTAFRYSILKNDAWSMIIRVGDSL